MILTSYYNDLKSLARQVRTENGLNCPRVTPVDLRGIYRKYGIGLDIWPYRFRNLRGAFFCDKFGPTVMLAKGLPQDPMAFTMAHELKHFLKDRDLGLSYCDQSNMSRPIEVGAEIFAAELLFPDCDFIQLMEKLGVKRGNCRAEDLVHLKLQTRTTLSYSGLAIKAERLWFAKPRTLTGVKTWRKLERQIRSDL